MKMREIKFRAWDGDRMQNVLTLGLYEGFVDTNKLHSDIEDFKLMQYTGLKDKNGKEIYEGDIVCIGGAQPYEVITNDFSQVHCIDNDLGQEELYKWNKLCKVIGNIYENPELLEESK